MKLFYITRTMIPSDSAQSVQIAAMCKAFSCYVENFKLISSSSTVNQFLEREYQWIRIKIVTPFRYLEFVLRIFFYVIGERPTHIFTRDIVVAYIFSFWKIKIVYEAHKEPRTKTAHWMMQKLKNKNNFLLITISKALKDYYVKQYLLSSEKICDYHDGVFIDDYESVRHSEKSFLRNSLSLPEEKFIVMHTGSLYAGRGAELFEVILKNFPDIYFVHVGGLKEDIESWRSYYQRYSNIAFVEHQKSERLICYQMAADLLFYPLTQNTSTWWCCSPMKIFEYMATGIPILGSNIGSLSEVLNEENSFIFDPNNIDTIIRQIHFLLENPSIARQRALRAHDDVKKYYRWEVRVQKILEFIR